MTWFRAHRPILVAAAIVVGMGMCAPVVFAAEFSSGTFRAVDPNFNDFGGSSTSTSFSAFQTGGQAVTGEASSTSFTVGQGFQYFDTYAPATQNWEWFDDETNETPSSSFGGENVAPSSVGVGEIVKLRIAVAELADIGLAGTKFRLQYATSSDFSTQIFDLTEEGDCSVSSAWCYANGSGTDNVLITTTVLSDSDPCVASVGSGCGTHNETALSTSTATATHLKSAVVEYEFTIEQSNAAANTVFFFRLVDAVSERVVPLNTGESYPSIAAGGATLSFTIEGLPVATSTEGVTTSIETTPTTVPFGSLPIGTPVTAAQRLTVSANAANGYTVFAYQRHTLLSETGDSIDPITGTNASPIGWSSGCTLASAGCYGYHSGEDVLAGGSTRFAANDSYARFDSAPEEVAYASGPVTERSTDVVYQVKVTDQQAAGSYNSSVVYIVVPVF